MKYERINLTADFPQLSVLMIDSPKIIINVPEIFLLLVDKIINKFIK
jgi:hypothetical protein